MQPAMSTRIIQSGNSYPVTGVHAILAVPGSPAAQAVTDSSTATLYTDCPGRISMVATGAAIAFLIGDPEEADPTAVAGTSHLLLENERIDLRVAPSFKLAAVVESGSSGTLRISYLY